MTTPSKLLGVGVPSATAREICGTVERDIVAAGTNAATAAPISHTFNIVSVVPSGTGVRLVPAEEGATIFVLNESSNMVRVYPYSADRINNLLPGIAYQVESGASMTFVGIKRGEWVALGSPLPISMYIEGWQKGAPGGVAALDENGIVPAAQLPDLFSLINDAITGPDTTWSSQEIVQQISEATPDIPDATPAESGLMSAQDKTKLNGIASGATKNDTDANLKNRANHTGTQAISTVEGLQTALNGKQPLAQALTDTTAAFTTAQRDKLAGVAAGAQVNAVTSVAGKTGAVVLAKSDVGLPNVDNTSDLSKPISTATQTALNNKVDKVSGYGLSQQNYTLAEKQKLASIEGSHFKGVFVSLAALIAGVASPVAGDYADVDEGPGSSVARYVWDATDGSWVGQGGEAAPITAAQVKTLYEANPDTNAFTDADKGKLEGIAAGATANQTDAYLRNRANHTGTQAIGTVEGLQTALDEKVAAVAGKGLSTNDYTTAEKNKLAGIATGATANQTDAYLLNRANHTGTQPASSVTGLATVATSGSYADLINTPTIPAAQVPADWNASTGVARILNKPTIPTIPGVATTTTNGLMSAADKTKLNAVGTMANRGATISTADPSGGVNGDVWFKVL